MIRLQHNSKSESRGWLSCLNPRPYGSHLMLEVSFTSENRVNDREMGFITKLAWVALPALSGCGAASQISSQATGTNPGSTISLETQHAARFAVVQTSDNGLVCHEIDFGPEGLRSGSFPARSFKAMTSEEAWQDSIFSMETQNMDATYSDLASCHERTAVVSVQNQSVNITLSRPKRFFDKSHFRAFYQISVRRDLATGGYAPVPLKDRKPSDWAFYLTEPRPQAGGWYPMKDIDKSVSFELALPLAPTWKLASKTSQVFARSLTGLSSSPSSPTSKAPEIPDMTIHHMPPKPSAWIVVFFQTGTGQKLKAFAQKNNFGLSTVASAGSKYSRHQAAMIRLNAALEERNLKNIPIVPVGFSAGGVTAMNATVWFPEFIPGAVVDGHTDLAEIGEPWTLRSRRQSRISLLTGKRDAMDRWNADAHKFGLQRGQPRMAKSHPGGHVVAPITDYQASIKWVLQKVP